MEQRDAAIGSTVHRLRTGRGLSQQDIADAMRERGWKWNQTTAWSIEADRRPLRLSEAVDLAAVLGTTVEGLLQSPLDRVLRTLRTDLARADRHWTEALEQRVTLHDRLGPLEQLQAAASGQPVTWTDPVLTTWTALGWMDRDEFTDVLTQLDVPEDRHAKLAGLHEHISTAALHTDPMDLGDLIGDYAPVWAALSEALPTLTEGTSQ